MAAEHLPLALRELPATNYERLIELTIATCASVQTRRMYKSQLLKFLRTGLPLNREGVALHLQRQRDAGKGSSTLISSLAAIRKFVAEAAARQLIPERDVAEIASLRVGKTWKTRMGTWLTISQVQELLALPDRLSYWGKRDACCLGLLCGCGLRRAEMAGLMWDRYQSRDGRMCLVDVVGKGGKRRTLPVPLWAQPDVDAWYSASRYPPPKSTIPSPFHTWRGRAASTVNGHLERLRPVNFEYIMGGASAQSILDLVQGYGERIGVHLAPHDLRRSLAQMLRKSGAPLEQIQYTLGHESINTTVVYLGSKLELAPGVAAVDLLQVVPGRGALLPAAVRDRIDMALEKERVEIEDQLELEEDDSD